jgi:hypothetical protein
MMIALDGETLVAESHTPAQSALKKLEDRAFKTYKARLFAAKRLRARGVAWNASLVAFSTSTTVASVALLSDEAIYGRKGATLLAVLAVCALSASLVVTNMDYAGRAQAMDGNYRRMQQIALSAEAGRLRPELKVDAERVRREYEIALESSENHSDADYFRSMDDGRGRILVIGDMFVTFVPWLSLGVAIAVAIPLVSWFLADG